ncbi:hypothetical protein CGRA01v4_02329 [Colletotrichum graminicola]|uniref:Uncharacterized protein n=1 Tax=Colletotrichum graminicola (strain M1.001 / M2 / FGSC 10212) TaxID=645133 RepID=E3Q3L3_COLGM|nr:uncharacterized protein GLRG_00759 [Colletotrichum graminicola M1.001]EFQ25615.1 hypothetical protein GLRG_00759 [Colletotrichum graminicola M1.001]WDK11050.1 hypothetical protein CGRA01v4_02329 [Colletotrichum graminicola]
MAPLRRYLRITKYSVLECRIYLDNPALAQSWLLNPRNPILPKVIESVRHLVLPKLREEKERERTKKKSSKKKSIKDVVVQDEFEVSMFLTETNTRHSLLTKHKHFRDKATGRLQSNSNKLIGETNDAPIDLDMEAEGSGDAVPVREESEPEGDAGGLSRIPVVDETSRPRRSKRQRGESRGSDGDYELPSGDDAGHVASAIEIGSEDDISPPSKRIKKRGGGFEGDHDDDDKKKMAMDVSYEGFAIYGRVLCLVVKKRHGLRLAASSGPGNAKQPAGQASMENWISSTQMPNPGAEEDAS